MKRIKLMLFYTMVILVFTPLTGTFTKGESQTSANKKPIMMRCASEFAPPELISVILKEMEEKVTRETDGRVKFEYYPAAQLYTFPDSMSLYLY